MDVLELAAMSPDSVAVVCLDVPRNRERLPGLLRLFPQSSQVWVPVADVGEASESPTDLLKIEHFAVPFAEEFIRCLDYLVARGVSPVAVAAHAAGTEIVPFDANRLPLERARFVIPGKKIQVGVMEVLLQEFSGALYELGLTHIVVFGSLLGVVRDGGPIAGDTDGDIAIIYDPAVPLQALVEHLVSLGFALCRVNAELLSFMRDDHYIDLYLFRRIRFTRRFHCLQYFLTEKNFRGSNSMAFRNGGSVPVPDDPESLLRGWYGPEWRTPQDVPARSNSASLNFVKNWAGRFRVLRSALRNAFSRA